MTAQIVPLVILVAVVFSLIWGLLALIGLAYRTVRGDAGRAGRNLGGMAVVLTIAVVGWSFVDDQPLPTYMNSVTSSGMVFSGTLVVEENCVFIDLDEPGGGRRLLYFPALTTIGFDDATGSVRFAFGRRASQGDSVALVGGVLPNPPTGWVMRRHDPDCESSADGFGIVEGLAPAG